MASLPAKQGNNTKENKSQLHEVSGVGTLNQACFEEREVNICALCEHSLAKLVKVSHDMMFLYLDKSTTLVELMSLNLKRYI